MHIPTTRKYLAAAGLGALLCAASTGAYPLFDVSVDETEAPIPAVEYYNAGHDQYFVTTSQDEMAALDAGVIGGWARTGSAPDFLAFADKVRVRGMEAADAGASPVCRFFIPPASHFLSVSPDECAAVAAAHPEFTLESTAAFYAWVPREDGTCPQLYTKIGGFEFQPVYRLWNGRPDTNHRFTANKAERDAMVDEGWVSEGAGDDGVAMCVPVWK